MNIILLLCEKADIIVLCFPCFSEVKDKNRTLETQIQTRKCFLSNDIDDFFYNTFEF